MADPISVVGYIIGFISLGLQIFDEIQKSNQFLQQSAEARLRTHYGGFPTLMVKILLPDAFRQVQLVEDRIFPGDDEVAIAFRNSYISDCNMTAFAVSFSFLMLKEAHKLNAPPPNRVLSLFKSRSLRYPCHSLAKLIGLHAPFGWRV